MYPRPPRPFDAAFPLMPAGPFLRSRPGDGFAAHPCAAPARRL